MEKKILEFKTNSFRKIPNPYKFNDKGNEDAEMFLMICDVTTIPEDIPMKTNPREQKLTTNVAKKIENSLINSNENNFYLLNRGLLLSADSVKYNSSNNTVTVTLTDENLHGNVDGGHTYKIIKNNQKNLEPGEQFVKVEILTGVDDIFQQLAAARNTSTQVQDKSIAELEKRFDIIKDAIKGQDYENEVFFKENEKGSIDVADILAILNMFNIDRYPNRKKEYPIISYSGKKSCIDYYIKTHKKFEKENKFENPYYKLKDIIPKIFELYDHLEIKAGDYYSDNVKNGKYGLTKGVQVSKGGKRSFKSKFTKSKLKYSTPNGFIYPIIGAFRALLKDNGETFEFTKDPIKVLDEIGPDLIQSAVEMSRELGNNPQSAGKSKSLWQNLHMNVLLSE